jgi:small subunit ribosomal protein S20
MPRSKSVLKRQRQNDVRRQRNQSTRSALKTLEKKARASMQAHDVKTVQKQLDKAAGKGIIHPNKAARKKSRLAKAAAKTP